MAAPAATFLTYSALGNREDLSNIIYRIDPADTPFMSGVEREKAAATNHEWQVQALAAASSVNSIAEGDDLATDTTTATVRLGNIMQISKKVARVSGTQRAVEHAGRDDELAYQEMLKGLELKRDMETILCGANQTRASTDIRALAPVLSWICTNQNAFNNTAGGSSTAGQPTSTGAGGFGNGASSRTDSTMRAFKEDQLKAVLQLCWNAGGKPDTIMVGGFNKQQFSTFTGRSTPVEKSESRRIVAAVDYYDSDFGKLSVAPNRFQRARDVLVLQMEMWAVSFLNGRNMLSLELAKTGDSDRRAIISEYTLVARNEKSSGGVFDVTSA